MCQSAPFGSQSATDLASVALLVSSDDARRLGERSERGAVLAEHEARSDRGIPVGVVALRIRGA
jgi:hypothetical protein